MTRALHADGVTIELGAGTWRARWPAAGVEAGPFRAEVELDSGRVASDAGSGSWSVSPGAHAGRAGTWARWRPHRSGVAVALHVPAEGAMVVVDASTSVDGPARAARVLPLVGALGLDAVARLADGYHSFAYAGVRPADDGGDSYWDAAFVAADGRALAVQALGAARLCTRVTLTDGTLQVACGATPDLRPVPGMAGYDAIEPAALDLPVDHGDTVRAEPVAIAAGRDALGLVEALAGLAGATIGVRRWAGPPVLGWESWYHYGLLDVTPDAVIENARLLRDRYGGRPGFDLVQLDDGWQVSYGAWWPNDRFPADLGELARELRAVGCRPGLWLAPFRVQPGTPGPATDHPEWCLRGPDGAPRVDLYGTWSLDASNPDVRAWLRDLGAQVRAWGFDMVKLDFLWLGAQEAGRYDARATGTESMRRGLGELLGGLGDDAYVLGCGMPMLPGTGLCHGARVGDDLAVPRLLMWIGQLVDEGWTAFRGVRAQGRNVAARWAHHRRLFDADPDVVMAWGSDGTDPAGYSIEEARTLATLAALCGGPFLLSDALAQLTPDERAVLEHPDLLDLAWGNGFRPVDLLDHVDPAGTRHYFEEPTDPASLWLATRPGVSVAALFNWGDAPARRPVPPGFETVTELWTGARPADGTVAVPPHGVRVLVRRG